MTVLSSQEQLELNSRASTQRFVADALSQLGRIFASPNFERVQQKAKNFLDFVVAKKLLDKEDDIKELSIAIAVYGEDSSYDPALDNKVRVAGRDLRQRLIEYYAREGQKDPVEILLPHGTFVPEIRERRPSIAVEMFENWNPNGDQSYLCTTVRDDILHRLEHAGGVRADRVERVEVGVQFRYNLRGSLECREDILRLNISLSDRSAARIIFSQGFEGRRDDLFKVSRHVVVGILDVLKPENGHFAGHLQGAPEGFQTLQLYQQGRFHLGRRTAVDIRKAVDFFEAAIEADGQYARAYSGLADCYLVLSWYEVSPPDRFWFETAKSRALYALFLNPGLPEVHTSLAYAKLLCDFDWAGAEEEFRQAILIQNRYAPAHHWFANLLVMQGRFEEAEEEMERALHLDSGSIVIRKTMGDPFYYSRRYEKAIDAYRGALKMDSNFWMAHLFLGWCYQQVGEKAKALDEFNLVTTHGGSGSIAQGAIGHLYATTGRHEEARSVLEQLKEKPSGPYVAPHSLAVIYAGQGDNDQSFHWLEASYEGRIELLAWIRVDPRFEALRSDSRFDQFLERIGLVPQNP
jgi:tetratricopeptide (TPR) repeat protein